MNTTELPPLRGMKVLDFTYLLPGPYGSMMLADLGADIIKVENFNNPDLMRISAPFIDGVSAAYAHINRGKRSLGLDLKTPGGREIVFRPLGEYDIVLEQFRPGVMERLGLGYEEVRRAAPSVIYCSLTGYGSTGRYAERAGHDINYLALSGIDSYSGRKSQGPTLSGIQIADVCGGGKNLAIAVMAAYIRRLAGGGGAYIDLSITDSTFALSAFQAAGFLAGGLEPAREGEILNGGSVYDYYRTSDGRYLSVGSLEPKFAEAFYRAIGMDEMVSPGLLSQEELMASKRRVAETIASRTLEHWRGVFGGIDACVEPVLTMDEAVHSPPLADRGMVADVTNHAGRTLRQVASPIKICGKGTATEAGAPIGHHNEEILSSLAYSRQEIDEFRKKGVIN
ncbi:MAG TPA: CaiB/BaiF CoA-transferase family protein [Spirochaetota bacterium]|nr:CaiB/BaiF CoA-transferase family protein [Spirochaetota bacterium]